MRFADRVARSPQQVVRYAYGGQPLWSASDPPKEERDVPPCVCGESALSFFTLSIYSSPDVRWSGILRDFLQGELLSWRLYLLCANVGDLLRET